jgi:hypothetical protein
MSKLVEDPRVHARSSRTMPGTDYERRSGAAEPGRRAGTMLVRPGTREALAAALASAAPTARSNRRAIRLSPEAAVPKAKD